MPQKDNESIPQNLDDELEKAEDEDEDFEEFDDFGEDDFMALCQKLRRMSNAMKQLERAN